jgi:shikimate kinase
MPTTPTRFILTGFMGSGKSTIGRLLATELHYAFLDLDTLIEQRTSKTVPEIFATEGEPAFRIHESAALAAALAHAHTVIALGGGAPEILANRETLAASPDTAVIYLAAPFATLYDRCVQQAADPTATTRPNMITRDHAEIRFTRRQPHYTALATHIIESANLTPAETIAAILKQVASNQQ